MKHEMELSLAVALLAGVLIGLERQTAVARDVAGGTSLDIGGVRTFPLIALGGALCGTLAGAAPGGLMPAVGLAALVALIGAHHLGKPAPERDPGISTETAAVVTFLLGVTATAPGLFPDLTSKTTTVIAVAVVVAVILSLKTQLHQMTARIQSVDLLAALQLLVVAVVFLPLAPDRGYGPYAAFNPAQMGQMVVLVGVIGFVGFVASRVWGAGRGMLVGGFIGGLVSSTAVTFSMARRVKETPGLTASCALSIVAASTVMLARVVVAAGVIYAPLLPRLSITLLTMLVASALASLPLWRQARAEVHAVADVDVKNPFELKSALLFGLAFAAVILVSQFARDTFGDTGLYVAAALAGITDVDAITLSTSALARDGLGLHLATGVIVTACFANTVVKGGIAWVSGGPALGKMVARVFGTSIVTGVVVLLLQLAVG
jgi:uncharacterized membrane protein (DUF4010 family)